MHVNFHDSHAYPGCAATLLDSDGLVTRKGQAVAEFCDGSITAAIYVRIAKDEIALHVSAYETACRTAIGAKSWKLARTRPGNFWKVKAKISGGAVGIAAAM